MTQEDKELLLKDLCARLPYHIRLKVWLKDGTTEEGVLDLEHNYGDVLRDAFYYDEIIDIKPFLRPMSSMTEEERIEFERLSFVYDTSDGSMLFSKKGFDWLNAHHFDYRGLIDKGLALEAPEGMYNIKNK